MTHLTFCEQYLLSQSNDGKYMMVGTVCPMCSAETKIEVSVAGHKKWVDGAYIQDALPELSANEREALITGICSSCWTDMFGEEENDNG